ncbi:hypothetical protein CCP3SC1AL1_2830001 [Gammaproteobacteria bacterium]
MILDCALGSDSNIDISLSDEDANRWIFVDEIQFVQAQNQYLGVITIQDINGDELADQAVLTMKSGNYSLRTVDSATGKTLKTVVLGPSTEITAVDLTSVGKQISVLITKSSGAGMLQLRDSTTLKLLKTLPLQK